MDVIASEVVEKRASRSTSKDKKATVEKRSLSSGFKPLTEETSAAADKPSAEEVQAKVSTAEEKKRKEFGEMRPLQSGVSDTFYVGVGFQCHVHWVRVRALRTKRPSAIHRMC